jgi:hypothetical protein
MPRHSAHHAKSFQRPALSPFLYDLGAASQALPPATILPEQFYSSPSAPDTGRGEVALMRAVLEDAIGCFQKQMHDSGRRVQRLAREAEEWLFTDDHRWPFSFVNICAVLGLEPEYVRLGLKRWRQHPPSPPEKKRQRGMPTHRSFSIAA